MNNIEFLSQSELLNLFSVVRQKSIRDWLIMCVQFNHALRPAEVCAIKMDDIKNGQLTVQRLKGSKLTTQPLRKHRGQPLLDEVRGLSAWLAIRPHDGGTALFTSKTRGGGITSKHYHRLFQQYAHLAGVPPSKSHPHVVRHSAITLAARQGMDIAWIQTFAGHSSIASTAHYTHLNSTEVCKKADDAFIDAFKSTTNP